MGEHPAWLILYSATCVVAVSAGFQLLRRWRAGRRAKVYERLCRSLRLSVYVPRKAPAEVPEMAATTQHVWGTWNNHRLHIFEDVSDHVEPGGSIATQTHVLLARPGWRYPRFLIEPRSMATNWRQKIDQRKGLFFPKDEAFTTSCFVDGPDHAAIRAALTPGAMRLLRGNRRVYVDCRGDVLLFYESEILLSARRLERLLALRARLRQGNGRGLSGRVPRKPMAGRGSRGWDVSANRRPAARSPFR